MPLGLRPTGSASYTSREKEARVSSGRGGSGNIIPAAEIAAADLNHEAELLRRRRMERKQEEVVKYSKKQYTGRGGTGNIKAASVAQWVSFDKTADPDDSYEDIVVERNKQAPKSLRTGRGGSGNLKSTANQGMLGSGSSRLSLSSNSNSSTSAGSSRLSNVSYASSFDFSPLDRTSSELSVLSRFSVFKRQREENSNNLSEPSSSRWRRSRQTDTPTINSQISQSVVNDRVFLKCLDEDAMEIQEAMEKFEDDGEEIILEVPELQPSGNHNSCEDTADEEEPDDELDPDNEDSEWERDVLTQAQYEISFHEL